jgi:hypothetical protein
VARLARVALGDGVADEELLRRLSMVSDAGQARLAGLWVDLAVAAASQSDTDVLLASDLASRIEAEGPPAGAWLRSTAATLGAYALEVSGRNNARVTEPVRELDAFLSTRLRAGESVPAETAVTAVRHCLSLARFVRSRAGIGPGAWRQVPVESAAQAVGTALARGLSADVAVDLLDELLEADVDGADVLEACVCATAQLLVELDPHEPTETVGARIPELLDALPKSARWLMIACLSEAPEHDPAATDLRPFLPSVMTPGDATRQAAKGNRRAVLTGGLTVLESMAGLVGESLGVAREELLALVLPAALMEHDLLTLPEEPS